MVLGIAVLVIALIALREPAGHVSGAASATTIVVTSTPTSSATRSPSPGSASSAGTSAGRTASSGPRSSTGSSTAGARAVPLIILNNTTIPNLAGQAAQRFGSGGWTVTRFGNLPGNVTDVISTCAYYDPATSGAQAAAQALQRQFPVIKRVKKRFADLPAGPIVVVLTPDYSGA